MKPKRQKFCDEYLVNANATEAAIKAGYSPKTAKSIGQRLLTFVDVKQYIEEQLEQLHDTKIADRDEVLQYLTAVMRGEHLEQVPILCGEGCQRLIDKNVSAKERLKAAELIGRRYGIFAEKIGFEDAVPVVIVNGDGLED